MTITPLHSDEYYFDYDPETNMYGVYHTSQKGTFARYPSPEDAEDDARKRNREEQPQ